jgi:hypothetical protein
MGKQGKRLGYQPRLSRAESEEAFRLIHDVMARIGVRSVYALVAITPDLNPSTMYRWFADVELGRVVELPIQAVRELADALIAKNETEGRSGELEALLETAERRESRSAELIAEFRAHRVPYGRALAAIRAARHRLVPIDESVQE